jgi:predicted nuclease of predicted toxin-antitoxin system
MKLLFDHNLSPRLVHRLADLYPASSHIFLVGLDQSPDLVVWTYAQINDYIIVTKDTDFSDMSVLRGFPPKVVWLRLGNCTTNHVNKRCETAMALLQPLLTTKLLAFLRCFNSG